MPLRSETLIRTLTVPKTLASSIAAGKGLRWFLRRPRRLIQRFARPAPPPSAPSPTSPAPASPASAPLQPGRFLRHASFKATSALKELGLSLTDVEELTHAATKTPGRVGRECYSTDEYYFVISPKDGGLVHFTRNNAPRATATRPEKQTAAPRRAAAPRAKKLSSATKKPTRLPVPSSQRAYLARLKERGFEIHHGKNHAKITHPEHPQCQCVMPVTASDHRWIHNSIRDVRHEFGVDLRLAA